LREDRIEMQLVHAELRLRVTYIRKKQRESESQRPGLADSIDNVCLHIRPLSCSLCEIRANRSCCVVPAKEASGRIEY
jgi:hypothetical protein